VRDVEEWGVEGAWAAGVVMNFLCNFGNYYTELYIKMQSVPRSKHSVSVIQTNQLMLYREIIAICSEIHTKHTVWAERRIVEC